MWGGPDAPRGSGAGCPGPAREDAGGWRAVAFEGIAYHVGKRRAVGTFPEVAGTGRRGLGIRRLVLDALFVDAAGGADGIELRTGTVVKGVEVGADGVRVATASGTLCAQAVVGADGLNSLVRRQLRLVAKPTAKPRYGG